MAKRKKAIAAKAAVTMPTDQEVKPPDISAVVKKAEAEISEVEAKQDEEVEKKKAIIKLLNRNMAQTQRKEVSSEGRCGCF